MYEITDINAEMTQILELSYKDIKTLIKILQQLRTNTVERNGKIESLKYEIEDIRRNQTEDLEMKNKITNLKNLLNGLNSGMVMWKW